MYGNFVSQQKRPYEFDQQPWGGPGDGGHVSRADGGTDRRRKKKSRWGAEETLDKTVIPGMPTVIPANLSKEQERQYILHLQIEEISRRLRTGDLGIPPNPEDRSPSPEPIYNNEGKRLNTREYRTRKKLEEERHKFVTEAMSLNTDYKPPADYKPPIIRVNDKVMIPQEEHPDINFVGLLIGPRGNTLKTLEKETGAKIIIRGKGSVKDGKIGRKDGQPLPGEDEPLHAYVTANNPENVRKAVEKIKHIIKESVEVPEGQNDLRKQQLRELALLNGTLRENDGLMKLKQLQQAQNIVTNTIICTNCGGTGHLGKDCKQLRPGDTFRNMMHQEHMGGGGGLGDRPDKAKMDSEYMSLMAELGQGPPPPKQDSMLPQQRMHGHHHQHHHHSRFNQAPPNPMGGFNNYQSGNNNRHPPMISNNVSNVSRPPMNNNPQMANNNQPRQMFQQQPNSMQQQGMQGMQPSNQMQQHQLQPNIQQQQHHQQQQQHQHQQQPGSMPQFQALQQQQQQQQNPIPQPVAPPNTITSQFQPNMQANMQPQMTSMSSAGIGPVQPPNTQYSTMAAPVPPPQWSNTQAIMSQMNTNATQSQAPAMGVHPPPSLVSAPPPPPPSQPTSAGSNMPWLQGSVPPPPPSSQPTWQAQPPPPPASMSQIPWQQGPPPPAQSVNHSNIVPPPPPPSSGYNMPPRPSGGFDHGQLSGVSQLLVAPPPPPPN